METISCSSLLQHLATKKKRSGARSLIVLDLDDTLIDCRYRKQKVFKDFCQHNQDRSEYRSFCQTLVQLDREHIQFRVSDCLKQCKIDHPQFTEELIDYWRQHYFSNNYLNYDKPFPGAVQFVKNCLKLPIGVIYLTGRSKETMGSGTEASLKKLGFPMSSKRTRLMMKLDSQQPDRDFKKKTIHHIAYLGHVVASLENEIRNLNDMAAVFNCAMMVHRPTLMSPNQPEPHSSLISLKTFVSD